MGNSRLNSHTRYFQTTKGRARHDRSAFVTTKKCDPYFGKKLCIYKQVNKYWIKQMYTAALRLGLQINEHSEFIKYRFTGNLEETTNLDQHNKGTDKYFGTLEINGQVFNELFVVIRDGERIITFYPEATQTSAYKSSTNLLVSLYTEDVESGNTPDSEYSFKMVSTYYHNIYKTNPGINAQRVMNELYANSSDSVKQRIKDLESKLLIEALKNDNCNDKLTKAQKKLDDNHE